jgi:predicted enzyme related to lactoylglutathione lyase
MDKLTNSLNWFEIPVTDVNRASKFYSAVFGVTMDAPMDMMGMTMVNFPNEMGNGKVYGALVKSQYHKPSQEGCTLYLNANPKIQTVIDQIEKAGGKVVMPKTDISPEIGVMAFFIDTEGNRIGLHAQA